MTGWKIFTGYLKAYKLDNQREKDNFPKIKKLQSINNNSYQISFQVNFRKLILSIEKNNNEKKKTAYFYTTCIQCRL